MSIPASPNPLLSWINEIHQLQLLSQWDDANFMPHVFFEITGGRRVSWFPPDHRVFHKFRKKSLLSTKASELLFGCASGVWQVPPGRSVVLWFDLILTRRGSAVELWIHQDSFWQSQWLPHVPVLGTLGISLSPASSILPSFECNCVSN